MARQRAPGVYFEPADPPPRTVGEVRTDITGFVGVSERGPLHVPVKLESWTQFLTRFGDFIAEGFLAHAVRGFFANGGRTCWVVRVGALLPSAKRASLWLVNRGGEKVFRLVARDDGPGSQRITVRVEPATQRHFGLSIRVGQQILEVWRDLNPSVEDRDGRDRYALDLINGTGPDTGLAPEFEEPFNPGSVFIRIEEVETPPTDRTPTGVIGPRGNQFEANLGSLAGTEATLVLAGLTLAHFTGEDQPPDVVWGLRALETIDEVSLVCVPDLVWPGIDLRRQPRQRLRCQVLCTTQQTEPAMADTRPRLSVDEQAQFAEQGQLAVIRHCALMGDRFAILDVPAGRPVEGAIAWATKLRSEAGRNAALYYPWVYVQQQQPADDPVMLLPPSGHVCGMIARVDLAVGVQKPPANETLEEVRGVESEADLIGLGWLNDEGVNAIRPYPGRGVRVAGARTLYALDQSQWRYVNVRRLVLMLEASLDQASQWLVFEGNVPDKWREIDRVVRAFLDRQWRRGRLDGEVAEDAYSVTCDSSTNPPAEVDGGRMNCAIEVRPPLPSEFVFVRLGRSGESGGSEIGGSSDA